MKVKSVGEYVVEFDISIGVEINVPVKKRGMFIFSLNIMSANLINNYRRCKP
jgi:hypothetical protein